MAKVDVKSAYRNIPIHPEDHWMTGMLWDGALYTYTCLPLAYGQCQRFSQQLLMQLSGYCENKSLNFVIYYLDNFLVIGAPSSPECTADLTTQLRVFDLLGLLVAVEKLEGPCPCLSFLGFELDLEAVVIHLPLPKLAMLQHLLKSWENQQLCTGKDLESWSESRLMPAKWCSPGRLS